MHQPKSKNNEFLSWFRFFLDVKILTQKLHFLQKAKSGDKIKNFDFKVKKILKSDFKNKSKKSIFGLKLMD